VTAPSKGARETDPRRIFEIFGQHQVDYVVIGGIAVIAHGHTRNTRDVDFMAAADAANLAHLAAALRELGARRSGVDAHLLGIDIYDLPGALTTSARCPALRRTSGCASARSSSTSAGSRSTSLDATISSA